MKAEKILTGVIAFILAMVLALGAVGCLVTAFSLNLESFGRVISCCALASLFCAFFFSFRHGCIPVALAGAAWIGYQWRLGEFGEELRQLIYRISHVYNQAYHWGVIQLVDTPWDAGAADLPMIALGIALAAAVTWTVCRGKGGALPVCLSLTPLLLCVVVTDTVPSERDLYLLLLGQILLTLTGGVRRENTHQGNRLTMLAALPVILALGALFLAIPKEGYVSHADTLREKMTAWFQKLPQQSVDVLESVTMTFQTAEPETVDLASLGRRRDTPVEIMEVAAENGGTLYLRGQDYDLYDGTSWRTSPNRVETFGCQGVNLGYVVVQTRQEEDRMYLPYYPRDELSLIGGRYENLRITKEYSFVRYGLPEGWQEKANSTRYEGNEKYLALPEDTGTAARELLTPILEGKTTRTEKAQAIADYVRQSASYSRDTDPMGADAGDFALWFLREGETGYCVHFATAATVLLRAAGIEARYVSGYMKPVTAGQTEVFTGENAHAWAEYYAPGLDAWVILEATPSEGLPSGGAESQETQTLPETLPPVTETPEEQPQTQPSIQAQPTENAPEAPAIPAPQDPPEGKKSLPAWIGKMVTVLLTLALSWGGLEGQRAARLGLRRWEQHRGDSNRMALHMWRETERVAKLLRQPPPEQLKALALKAKFSQHTLTDGELTAFTQWLAQGKASLKEKPFCLRMLYRYIFAVI